MQLDANYVDSKLEIETVKLTVLPKTYKYTSILNLK